MGKVQRRDEGLSDVGVDVTRDRGKPRFDRIERLMNRDETSGLYGPLDDFALLLRGSGIGIGDNANSSYLISSTHPESRHGDSRSRVNSGPSPRHSLAGASP